VFIASGAWFHEQTRFTSFNRGTLNANKDGTNGTPSREQTWTLHHVDN